MAPPDEVDSLMDELLAWCKARHGRQKELAEEMKVSEALVSSWLARRKTPTLEYYFKLRAFMKKVRRRK
jgi:transcriptional regulator with XRE-family HTH domain